MNSLTSHPDEVAAVDAHLLAVEGHRIVDVREHHEFAAGHAPGAVPIPAFLLAHGLHRRPGTVI